MTRTYPYGYRTATADNPKTWPAQMLTLAELDKKQAWAGLHPEVRRRHIAIFDAAQDAGTILGIGGGHRSAAHQEATFRSRYVTTYVPGSKSVIVWQGQTWYLKKGYAPSTPPGRSYHEECPEVIDDMASSWAYAVDTIGDWAFLKANCARFGLREFSEVNDEPWHTQPVELPTARRNYSGQVLRVFPLPPVIEQPIVIVPPVPPTPTPDPLPHGGLELTAMYTIELDLPAGKLVCRVTADKVIHETNGDAANVDRLAGVKSVPVDRRHFLALLAGGRRTEGNPFTGAWYDAELAAAWAARA